MSQKLDLDELCAEIQALAGRINAEPRLIPMCRRNGRSGWSLDLSDDGNEYVYSGSEKGVPYDLFRSADEEHVLEFVLVDLCEKVAMHQVVDRYPPTSRWRSWLEPLLPRPSALKQQREIQIAQEHLLGQINADWQYRCAVANALRLRRDVDFWFGVDA